MCVSFEIKNFSELRFPVRALWLQLGKLLQNSWYQSERTLAQGHSLEKSSPDYQDLYNYGTITDRAA